ncbi:hypothetical protein HMPREF3221_00470 [Fusobacterium nucleatum]|uniref:Uncharacterized protein n=1 Tax=Fusobacterium nucleatum TaxID=851 RepID=A0A133P7L0_FUSNU|nr:hypothetical protein HMPREF3221_00470 [Fusobacterium nucleatum]
MKNKTLHFLLDSRHFLEDLKKGYKKLLIFFLRYFITSLSTKIFHN